MKISILTATYNRGKLLGNLYNSLKKNSQYLVKIEWLVMDDGSIDETEKIIKEFQKEEKIEIKYYKQKNQGKMVAINNLVGHATGEIIIDCDSDDYFTEDSFKIIKEEYEKNKERKDIYGICFLKYNQKGENVGKKFKNEETTMFDLYFKEGENGEKPIAFFSNVRKKYKHEIEKNEKFITEARMYHKMDEKYKMICINEPVIIGDYQEEGYTKNINKQFINNPYGYYEYFKEILNKDMTGVLFYKRLYAIKHYILFSYLTKKHELKKIKNKINKILCIVLWIPGIIKSKNTFKKIKES